MLLGVETDHERGDVDDLLSDADVALADQDTGVVNGLGETELVDASLEAALEEILDLEGQDVIELHATLVEHTDTDKTANQGVAFEQTLGVLLVEGEQLTVWLLVVDCSFDCAGALRSKSVGVVVIAMQVNSWANIPGSTTNLGESELDTPDLTLVTQTILANKLQLGVPMV